MSVQLGVYLCHTSNRVETRAFEMASRGEPICDRGRRRLDTRDSFSIEWDIYIYLYHSQLDTISIKNA